MNFGEKLRLLRTEKGWHQPELAEKLGIEQSYLSKLENGHSLPSGEILDNVL
ncbi:MAG: helix-turn-helix transcriptional regulator, partial [Gammaproteobacteria bacterium]